MTVIKGSDVVLMYYRLKHVSTLVMDKLCDIKIRATVSNFDVLIGCLLNQV